VCWAQINPLFCVRVDPSIEDATTWKHKSMRSVVIDHGQLQIAVEWRGGYWFPMALSAEAKQRAAKLLGTCGRGQTHSKNGSRSWRIKLPQQKSGDGPRRHRIEVGLLVRQQSQERLSAVRILCYAPPIPLRL
jgi:hypothetical protein